MTRHQLSSKECIPYYQTYIEQAGELGLMEGLKQNGETIISFLESLTEEQFSYAYADDKWTIKELVQHIMDTERIFTYRALCFARKDKTPLPGYDQDKYANACEANIRTKESLLKEYKALRLATVSLFESFSDDMLLQFGNASQSDISVRALGFILIGHENHHCKVIKERYI